jgi:hypothetical protein
MDAKLQKQYDQELARHEQAILALANMRLHDFTKEWQQEYTLPLKLSFGMGTVYVEVDGQQAYEEDYPELEEALRDVDDITDGYRRACPADITI